jgi:hypothetical protein
MSGVLPAWLTGLLKISIYFSLPLTLSISLKISSAESYHGNDICKAQIQKKMDSKNPSEVNLLLSVTAQGSMQNCIKL